MANHEQNFRYYFLYHIMFVKRGETELQNEYYSARGRRRAIARFRLSYPYEAYEIREVCQVLSFKDLKGNE